MLRFGYVSFFSSDISIHAPAGTAEALPDLLVRGELSLEAERAAGDQRPAGQHAGVVQQIAGGDVIGTVKHHLVLLHQLQRVTAVQSQVVRHHSDVVIQSAAAGTG